MRAWSSIAYGPSSVVGGGRPGPAAVTGTAGRGVLGEPLSLIVIRVGTYRYISGSSG